MTQCLRYYLDGCVNAQGKCCPCVASGVGGDGWQTQFACNVLEMSVADTGCDVYALISVKDVEQAIAPRMPFYDVHRQWLNLDAIQATSLLPGVVDSALTDLDQLAEVCHVDADEGEYQPPQVKPVGLRLALWMVLPQQTHLLKGQWLRVRGCTLDFVLAKGVFCSGQLMRDGMVKDGANVAKMD